MTSKLVEMIAKLEDLKLKHFDFPDDPYYSCPKSGDCANDSLPHDVCNCGADTHNAKVDQVIADLKKLLF